MSYLPILPVLLPAGLGALILLLLGGRPGAQRLVSLAGTAAILGLGLQLLAMAGQGQILVYRLGNWAAPFGIVLMLDRLAALMLVLTGVLALAVLAYAIGSGWDRRGAHFHTLWQFQLMGLNGAFLTGDAFNLFVFFEVLLIVSYGLMIHGAGAMRLRAGVQYIAYNLAGSTLFLAALGVLYAATGTLNMADMAARVAQMPPGQGGLVGLGAVLLMLVFALKAALVPLHFWLPATYANAPGPVAALFAIMTKVGVYGIIRSATLIFPDMALLPALLLPAAGLTLIVGQTGLLGARSLGRMAAFAALGSVGTLMLAVAQLTPQALAAGLYYLLHSTLAAGALFLAADMILTRRAEAWLRPGAALPGGLAVLYFLLAIAVTGMPPLSGFLGKLLILQASWQSPAMVWIWVAVLASSLLAICGMARAGSVLFWASRGAPLPVARGPAPALARAGIGLLVAALIALTVFAAPALRLAEATAAQLMTPSAYVAAVLQGQEGVK
jgi:multicomponent K+:H+ antiporter subunit D